MPRTLSILVILLLGILAAYFFLPPDTLPIPHSATQTKQESPTSNDQPPSQPPTQQEIAKTLAKQVTAPAQTPIDVSKAQHFVSADQLLTLPQRADAQAVQLQPAESSTTLTANSPTNTVASTSTQTSAGTGVNSYAVSMTPFSPNLTAPPKAQTAITSSTTNEAIQRTVPSVTGAIQLRELLDNPEGAGKIFYIHSVNQNDAQGIWGILQQGLTQTFAQGIQLQEADAALQTVIPAEADEVLGNKQSSFLGRLLHDKAQSTYIYNYQHGLVGQNPNLIKPGQQLIIVTFTEQELLDIYRHFDRKAP